MPQIAAIRRNSLQNSAKHRNSPQNAAKTPQNTAIRSNSPVVVAHSVMAAAAW
jgi:hypothetical protein